MLRVVALAWQDWGTFGRRTDRAAWVAIKVNKVFGKVRFIRPTWVNQNRKTIEALLSQDQPRTPQLATSQRTPSKCGAHCRSLFTQVEGAMVD